jgi:YegS/Rv2252/BmrU family lipid kinase
MDREPKKPLPVVLNRGSGAGSTEETVRELERLFAARGLAVDIHVASGHEIERVARELLRESPAILVAAGGDGTVSAVASCLQGTATALAVLPLGTLNHFARDIGMPLDIEQAVEVIARGASTGMDMCEVNGRHFVNNASLGLYPDIVRDRTRQQRRLGRGKYWAMLWATFAAVRRHAFLHLDMDIDGRRVRCRAPFVFIGNNDYVMEGFAIGRRASLREGHMSVYTTRRRTRRGIFWLAIRALFGRLRQADDFFVERASLLRIESRRSHLHVAVDGEVWRTATPLSIRVLPGALRVVVPAP